MSAFVWKKLGKVFDPSEIENRPDWLNEFAQAPCVLKFDDFIRVYFSCRPKPDTNGQYVSYSAYVDLDRKNLFQIQNIAKEPILNLGKLGTFDEFGIYPVSVIEHEGKILAYYGGWTRCESVPFDVAIGCAISANNGISFQKMGNGPILSFSPEEPFIISGPKIRKFNGLLYLFYIAGTEWMVIDKKPEPIYKIRLAISKDGVMWAKCNKDLIENRLGENEAQASPDVIYKNGKYHMFFCYRQASDFRRNKTRSYRIGYAVSNDLLNWERDDTKVGIDVSETGFDNEMVAYPHVFELDNKIYMFYLGNQVGRYGFGLAELEGDLI
jgi:predicted GH43/DUF377 family glycosyl hydrolase